MKYIPADKLIAEIETRKNNNLISASKCPTGYFSLVANEDIEILGIVNSLQQEQPGSDLEKEIGRWMDKLDDRYCVLVEDYSIRDIKDTARHFYELGLNAKKEE